MIVQEKNEPRDGYCLADDLENYYTKLNTEIYDKL